MRPATVAFACLLTPAAGAWADEPPARPATAPLAPAAFVSRPPALRGVAAWTIETVGDDYPSFGRPVYSPDGKRVAVPGQHGVVRVWDVGGRRLARVLYPS